MSESLSKRTLANQIRRIAAECLERGHVPRLFPQVLAGLDPKLVSYLKQRESEEIASVYWRTAIEQLKKEHGKKISLLLDKELHGLIRKLIKPQLKPENDAFNETLIIKNDNIPAVLVRQEAVGHGGFHNGVLGTDKPYIRWIYDCGTWKQSGKAALDCALNKFAVRSKRDGRPVDLLFISHFDADHLNGLKALFDERFISVDMVVVPYLSPAEAFMVLAGALTANRLTRSLAEQVLYPSDWFAIRGVRRLIRIRPGPARPTPEAAAGPASPTRPFSEERTFQLTLLKPDGRPLRPRQPSDGSLHEIVAQPGTTIAVSFGRAVTPIGGLYRMYTRSRSRNASV
jgi:Metallo-beta-lactamase superfamily